MRAIRFLLIFLCPFFNSGCEKKSENIFYADGITTFSGEAMTIAYKVMIGEKIEASQSTEIKKILAETFDEVNLIYNKWNPNSEVSKLNALKAGVEVCLSEKLYHFLQKVQYVHEITLGKFDPTIEPIQQLWKKALQKGLTPSQEELEVCKKATGWHCIHFSNGIFSKSHDKTALDLGGIAKGFCVDLIVERIAEAGYSNCLVEWGGEIRTLGRHPSQRAWRIFISRFGDDNPDRALTVLDLEDQSIATSGDYLQNWTIFSSKMDTPLTYFHIFDAESLSPLQATHTSVASASVVAPTCFLADGLATAAMMFSSMKESEKWIKEVQKKYPDVTFLLISREGL